MALHRFAPTIDTVFVLAFRGQHESGAIAACDCSPAIATRPTEEAGSKRDIHTAAPTAQRLKLQIEDGHTHGNEADLAQEVLAKPHSV